MSAQIFLYISNGRTLWVPRHTASPTETKPVCMLNYVTPMELSRSFYLFDYEVQVVENAQMAAVNPNAKTPNEVLAAVNDFRRVCAEDQNFLLQRCYNSPSQQQQQQQQPQQQQQQQQQQPVNAYPTPYASNPSQQQQLMMSPATTSGYGGVNNNSNNTGTTSGMDSATLLTQLLQQQRQQGRMMGGGNTGTQGYPDNNNNGSGGGTYGYNNDGRNYYGVGGNRGDRRMLGNVYGNNMGYPPNMMMQSGISPQQQQPMMGYNNVNPYSMDQMMMYGGGPGQMYPNARGGGGRRGNNYGDPMMMMHQHPGMYGNRRGMGNNPQSQQQSRMGATVRNEPEPINLDGVTVPAEIKTVYMNPAQQLVIATMPGPHMTVWLREHPFPTDLQDKKFVFGKKGICLMLKAAFEEVKGSKPVELFSKQICTHFFIYGYCSRPNCFHEHHTEDQLRELIAVRHVQLKSMTKTQRHQLIDEIEQKDKEGLAAAAAHREEREKKRAEAAAEREARRQQRQQQSQQSQAYTPSSVPTTQPNPSQDIGSDNEDDIGTTLGGIGSSQQQPSGNQSLSDMMASSPSQDQQAAATVSEAAADTSNTAVKNDITAKLGITDSDDDDDDDDESSSSSATRSSSVTDTKTKAGADAAEASAADEEDEGEADEDRHDVEGEEEEEHEEEGDESTKAKKSKAKKPAPKKRARAAAPKKATKRAKK